MKALFMTYLSCKSTAMLFMLLLCPIRLMAERPYDQTWYDSLSKGSIRAFAGVENFRGLPDAGWEDNNGYNFGAEGTLPLMERWGAGIQAGGSFGVYNLAGKGSSHKHSKNVEKQGFATIGIFKKCRCDTRWGIGLAYDLMLTDNFSIYAQSPWLSQWRAQCAFCIGLKNEIGVRGSLHGKHFSKAFDYAVCRYKVSYRAISQATCYWKHLFNGGVESTIWAGVPFSKRLDQRRSAHAGKYIIGGEIGVSFWDYWTLVARAQYVQPSTKRGSSGSHEYGNNIAIAIVYDFGSPGCQMSPLSTWEPFMPLANNSNFLVDSKAKTTLKPR